MSYIIPTGGNSNPFATSTAFAVNGPTAFSEPWVATSTSSGYRTASLSGQAVGNCALQTTSGTTRFYFLNHNVYVQSAHAYYTSFQTYVESSDECIATDSSFTTSIKASIDTTTARVNLIKVSH